MISVLAILAFGATAYALVLRSCLKTAVQDTRYWRGDSEFYQVKCGQLTDLIRGREAEQRTQTKERSIGLPQHPCV